MNILYISNLSGTLWNGPNNSVPAQILAQSKIDNVFWFNYNYAKRKEWTENGLDCKNLQDFPNAKLESFPSPFNNPDIVVIEEFYVFPFNKLIIDVRKKNIPYVIVPRSQMTELAQKHKRIKKMIGNLLFFGNLGKNASAIQYLTEQEKIESENRWKIKNFIIPNGISLPQPFQKKFSENKISATYIGRVDIYQKGLDTLLESIAEIRKTLMDKNFSLTIYGPSQVNDLDVLKKMVLKWKIEEIVRFKDSIYWEEKQKILLNTDVFIMTSRFEGLPMGLIEALSYGIPCIATKGTNMADVIYNTDAGWVADNNKDSIKTALLQMCGSEKFKEKSENSYKLAQRYSWNEIAKKSHNEYEKIVKSKVY